MEDHQFTYGFENSEYFRDFPRLNVEDMSVYQDQGMTETSTFDIERDEDTFIDFLEYSSCSSLSMPSNQSLHREGPSLHQLRNMRRKQRFD